MSGSLSTPVFADNLPPTKHPMIAEESGGSNKRPRLNDDPWMTYLDSLNDAYRGLISTGLQSTMIRGSARAQRLLESMCQEIGDQLIVKLKELIASFADLTTSVKKWGMEATDEERLRLVRLAKQILEDWESIEKAIPQPKLTSESRLFMAPVDYPHIVPSAWLFEFHWRDKALEEVQSMRKKYSYLLDQTFRDSYTSYLKKNGVSGSTALLHKKLLKFVASSKEDIDFMSLEKCYKRVMSIKEICSVGLVSLQESGNLTAETQLPYWRDEIYDQIVAYRNMYSPKLDEMFRNDFFKITVPGATPSEADVTRFRFLAKSLKFLAHFRDGIAFLSEEGCREQLDAIKRFMEKVEEDSLPVANQGIAFLSKEGCPEALDAIKWFMEKVEENSLVAANQGIDFLSEEGCRKKLDAIKWFIKEVEEDSLPAANQAAEAEVGGPGQTRALTIWRDLEYEQVQNKRHRFMYELYDVYLKYKTPWSKMPACEGDLKKLEFHLEKALEFYEIPRCEMSLWKTREDYYKVFDRLEVDIVESIGLMKNLLGDCLDPSWDCRRFILLPKCVKLMHIYENRRDPIYELVLGLDDV